jgi:cell division protein FtsL
MELQEVFYWMAIIYMSIMFILMIALVAAVFVIKHKIHTIQRNIEEKIRTITDIAHLGGDLVDKAKATIQKHL